MGTYQVAEDFVLICVVIRARDWLQVLALIGLFDELIMRPIRIVKCKVIDFPVFLRSDFVRFADLRGS
jgi:hypothetical protein